MASRQRRQLQLVKGEPLDQAGGPGRQTAILPGHAHPPGQLAIPVQGDHPKQRRTLLLWQGDGPAPAKAKRRLAPAERQPVAGPLRRIGVRNIEGVARQRLVAAVAHYLALIVGLQWSQYDT